MAPPANKRRKTDHVSSGDEDDDVSFASFGDNESGDEEQEQQVNGLGSHDDVQDEDDDEDDDDVEMAEEAEDTKAGATKRNGSNVAVDKHTQRQKPAPKTSQASASASAYASGTFKSNMFKLQVDELLGQIRPRHGKREAAAEAALHALKTSIEQIPARGPSTVLDAERELIKEKVAIPFPDPRPPKDAKYKLSYTKPASINVVGSFALKTATRSKDMLEIDMMVTMPSSIFEDKDYLNHRYFYKRAYYLACLAAGLKTSNKGKYSFRFGLFKGNPVNPVLLAGPLESRGSSTDQAPLPKWRINIIPCVNNDQFPSAKLRPDRNCVRSMDPGHNTADEDPTATPFYNSSLRSEMLMTPYLRLLHGAKKSCEAYVDACLLGSTWLRQRGFGASVEMGGFGNFEWKALMALALQGGGPNNKPLLSSGYSSYQLFKATLQLIAMKEFIKHPLKIGNVSEPPKVDGSPVVWDSERYHNLLFKVSPGAYALLRYEAKSTLSALGDNLQDGFGATFILRIDEPVYRYDYVVAIPKKALAGSTKGGRDQSFYVTKLYEVLKRGLGDRVNQIGFTQPPHEVWDLGSSRPKDMSSREVKVGFVVNADTIKRTVDHGPSAENKVEAASFRSFWGERAELRRFKDGSILESLIWSSQQESGQSVFEQIVRYLLGHHFGLVTIDDLSFYGDDVSKLVRGGSDRTSFEATMSRYQQFEEDIRNLREMPLSIRSIMPADPQLRYSSLVPPGGLKPSQRPAPADVVLQFEGSGRWPDDLVAIQRTKIAFLIKLSELLQESVDSVTSRIGLENETQETLNQGYLDATYEDATFRLRIYHDREQTLHERRLKDKTVDQLSRETSALGLAKYKRDFVKTPAHTQAISRLCVRFPTLSGSIRLTKRWFASHLLTSHIASEIIELLVVRTFTQPWPWQTPSSVQTGFLRTLFWIARWDWRLEPLIVDLSASGDLKQADLQAITTNFEAWRKLDPSLNRIALFAASNVDRDGTTYTDGRPAKVVAGRMTALARAACAEIAEKGLSLDTLSLFSSPLEDFDFVLHLASSSKTQKSTTTFKNLSLDITEDCSLIGFDAISDLLHDLEAQYGSAILFFSGGHERTIIGGLWSPLTARRAWKVNLAYSTVPMKGAGTDGEDDAQAEINKTAVLAEIARLGGDLIGRIEVFEK